MPRGELNDYVLLCSYKDKNGALHGLGLRKAVEGVISITVASVARSSFEGNALLISSDVEEPRTIRVNPELHGITVESSELAARAFSDSDDVKDAISLLLQRVIRNTLHTYYGICSVQISGDRKSKPVGATRPSFVFISTAGQYTALPLTTTPIYAAASVYVNYIQSELRERSYWRATCFEPLDTKPCLMRRVPEANHSILRTVVMASVLTFNSLNCCGVEGVGLCDEDGVYERAFDALPCPYDRSL